MKVALHTRLKPGAEWEYDEVHRHVPAELARQIRAAGATEWTIWRSGSDVFHVLCCENYAQLLAALEPSPLNRSWQQKMSVLQVVTHDYGVEGGAAILPVVWDLTSDSASDLASDSASDTSSGTSPNPVAGTISEPAPTTSTGSAG